jgi:hypothetical protein
LNEYAINVSKILDGKPRRDPVKGNGEPQSDSNMKFRYVHLVLAVALRERWKIEHFPLENCEEGELKDTEKRYIEKLKCNMNSRPRWYIHEFEQRAQELLSEGL